MERLANSQLVHGLMFLVFLFSMQSSTRANVAVQDFDTHIEDAETVLIGMVKEGRQGQVILVVETSLKGAGKPNEEIIIDENSKLAWRHVPGGGPMLPTSHADFVRQIQQTDWYSKRMVLVGSVKAGKWVSYCYDWSVWTSGVSTRDETLKGLSFEELVEVIKWKLGKSTATHQVKPVSQATKAEKPAIAPNSLHPVVQSTESEKVAKPKLTTATPSEQPNSSSSSMQWSIIVVLIVAAIGLLMLLLKRRF